MNEKRVQIEINEECFIKLKALQMAIAEVDGKTWPFSKIIKMLIVSEQLNLLNYGDSFEQIYNKWLHKLQSHK